MSKLKKFWIFVTILIIVIISSIIVVINKYVPESKAEEKNTRSINVTYKSGIGEGEDVVVTQTLCDSQTQGTNDYTDGKIVLYRNGENGVNFTAEQVEYNGTKYDRILTGWKLTSVMKDGTEITNFVEPENQNYADRTNANKDIGTVYAEGGWYIVPNNVTEITLEAVYGRAIYIRSPYDNMYYDEYHIWYYGTNNDGTSTLDKNAVEKSSDNNDGGSIDKPISTLKRAYELINEEVNINVYDTVAVLCGDLYEVNINSSKVNNATGESGTYKKYFSNNLGYNTSEKKPLTIKSLTNQQYSLYMLTDNNYNIYSSVRFDNLYIQHLPVSKIIDRYDDDIYPSTYVIRRRFELLKSNITFEFLETNKTDSKRSYLWYSSGVDLKIYSGTWQAIATGWSNSGNFTKTISNDTCIRIGGTSNVGNITAGIGNDFSNGLKKIQINSGKINIMGGKIINAYSSSLGLDCDVKGDTYLFVNGGNIENLYGASYGNVCAYEEYNGDVNIFIYGGVINNIYGAGQRYTSNIEGSVNLIIKNVRVTGNIYGGGKGGTVSKNININIDNLTSDGNIYGAGYGLTDEISNIINRASVNAQNSFDQAILNYNNMINKNGGTLWNAAPTGFPVYNDTEDYLVTLRSHSSNLQENSYNLNEVEYRSSLTLSTVEGNVSINIKNSNIKNNVYGGGEISVVNGNADITIIDSTINGNIYGGGNGRTLPNKVKLYRPLDNNNYKEIKQAGQRDEKVLIGEFTWTNNEDILRYFNGIYDGKNKVVYDGTSEAKTFSQLLEEYKSSNINEYEIISNMINNYSNEQLIYSSNANKLGAVNGNIILNISNVIIPDSSYICGGGDTGDVLGDTNVILDNMKNISRIYAGGYSGIVYGNTKLTINSGTYANVFGGGYSGAVAGDSKVIINKGTFTNIFGGGDQSYVQGSTDVTVGQENSSDAINVTGLVYGGGRGYDANNDGDASDFTTVYGNSKVLIQGVNTSVENYGSTKLGAVAGNVDVNFKNYWSGNSTAKYQTMNGIDRATTVSFDNSYVLLENKDANGNLVGIQSIENLVIPKGSGLKISANGEITGNFEGGGELYLDSLVCLTVKGNITGKTTLVLNPKLMEDGTQGIRGGITVPYLKVAGTALEEEALVSGETNKYVIRQADKETVKEEIGEDYIYYYIAKDVIVQNNITVETNSIEGRKYKDTITNTSDTLILNTGTFTTDYNISYYLTDDAYKAKDYSNISRKLKLISNTDKEKVIIMPVGTEITMIIDGKYYSYVVNTENLSEISLSDFTNNESSTKYDELRDITNSELVDKSLNEINGTTTYTFKENYKFIINFTNTKGIEVDRYYPSLEVYYGQTSFGDEKKDVANNIVDIQKRSYNLALTNDQTYYESDALITLTGNLKIGSLKENTYIPTSDLYLKIKLKDSEGKAVSIPRGTQIIVNGNNYQANNGQVTAKLIDNLSTSSLEQNLDIELDMTKALPQDRLAKGDYKLVIEYLNSKQYKEITETNIAIIDKQTEYGLSTNINQIEGTSSDKVQLITKGQEGNRSIKINYSNSSELKNMKVKVKAIERTGEFEYKETSNSKNKISIDTTELNVGNAKELDKDINITFKEGLNIGTYRILVELYDEYGQLKTSDYVNFITN